MAMYIVPPDMKEKEKVVGGILTMSQFAWLMLGLGIIGVIFLSLYHFIGTFSLIVGVPIGLGVAIPFAFYKKDELTLFQYLTLKSKFKRKTKFLINNKSGGPQ